MLGRDLRSELLEPLGLRRLEMDQCLADGAGKALAADMKNYTDTAPTVVISEMH